MIMAALFKVAFFSFNLTVMKGLSYNRIRFSIILFKLFEKKEYQRGVTMILFFNLLLIC